MSKCICFYYAPPSGTHNRLPKSRKKAKQNDQDKLRVLLYSQYIPKVKKRVPNQTLRIFSPLYLKNSLKLKMKIPHQSISLSSDQSEVAKE
jgi:hypothetical protein